MTHVLGTFRRLLTVGIAAAFLVAYRPELESRQRERRRIQDLLRVRAAVGQARDARDHVRALIIRIARARGTAVQAREPAGVHRDGLSGGRLDDRADLPPAKQRRPDPVLVLERRPGEHERGIEDVPSIRVRQTFVCARIGPIES